jgi:hypothetical protein
MNSKSAAVLMLVGSFAVGAASMFTYEAVTSTPAADPCAPRVTEGNYRTRVYKDLGFTEEQQAVWDSLIDWRQKTINDIYALPRIKSDSVRRETESKQLALLTADQRTRLDERRAAMRAASAERQKLCEKKSTKNKNTTR